MLMISEGNERCSVFEREQQRGGIVRLSLKILEKTGRIQRFRARKIEEAIELRSVKIYIRNIVIP